MKSKQGITTISTIVDQEWYSAMVEECNAIMVESEFTSRWAIVEGYHQLGQRICEENDNFERNKVYGAEITKRVADSLDRSPRTVQKAIQFYKKYPNLDTLPAGKNTSWHQVCNKLLPVPKEKDEVECDHAWITICRKCGEKFTPK